MATVFLRTNRSARDQKAPSTRPAGSDFTQDQT